MKPETLFKVQTRLSSARVSLGRDFTKFRKLYFSHYHRLKDAFFHQEIALLLATCTTQRGQRVALAAPRGSAKSTIVSLEYVLYCICYKLERFIVLISSTNDQAVGLLEAVKRELETNPRLAKDFPGVCETGRKPGPPRWTRNEIVTRNGIKVIALGTGQQIRGRRNKEVRPGLIILDDIENDESAQNPENADKLLDWLTKSVLKSGTGETNVIYVGTIHHYHSLLARFTSQDEFPGWQKLIYKSILCWSGRLDLWDIWSRIFNHCEPYRDKSGPEVARAFFEANKEEMLKDALVLWPQSKSYYDLMVMREQEGAVSFDSEMQNEPVNPRDCIFNVKEFHYWDDSFGSEDELLSTLDTHKDFYGACDPSMGKQNRHSDYSAIITAVRDTKSGVLYILDADIERRLPDKTIESILAHQTRRNYVRFGFETNQFQEFMAQEIEKRSRERGIYVSLEQIKHSSDKRARIESLQPLVKNGTIRFCRKHRMLLEQMKYFPKGAHDDGVDALEMVVKLCQDAAGKIGMGFLSYNPFTGEAKMDWIRV